MLLDPRLPYVVGSIIIAVLMGALYRHAPMPGDLSNPHAEIEGISRVDGCVKCHHPDGGLTEGCLGCHEEIADQLHEEVGYHSHLWSQGQQRCGDCHREHLGHGFLLINRLSWGIDNPRNFEHPHVDFELTGSHDDLSCGECHDVHRDQAFHLPQFPEQVRTNSYLGLTQQCMACHEDPHAEGLAQECGSCHGQEVFGPPAHFDHGEHLPLLGGHDDLECNACHDLPAPDSGAAELPFPFDRPQGTTCQECHDAPHRVAFAESCDVCHESSEPLWLSAVGSMTRKRHAQTGFALDAPHEEVACSGCHAPDLPFGERHPDRDDPDYLRRPDTCRGCHTDAHAGQFAGRFDQCLTCHDQPSFLPTTFGHDDHETLYPLEGAHAATACTECHEVDAQREVREFSGTSHACRDCHATPHAGQFADQIAAADCVACHETSIETFRIQPFDHVERTGFELEGAHGEADCASCHVEVSLPVGTGTAVARRFEQTPKECAGCHVDVHRQQFAEYGSCATCHFDQVDWTLLDFDHELQSRFPLKGVHRDLECSACHRPVPIEGGGEFVRYRPLGHDCRDCHEIDPRSTSDR